MKLRARAHKKRTTEEMKPFVNWDGGAGPTAASERGEGCEEWRSFAENEMAHHLLATRRVDEKG